MKILSNLYLRETVVFRVTSVPMYQPLLHAFSVHCDDLSALYIFSPPVLPLVKKSRVDSRTWSR